MVSALFILEPSDFDDFGMLTATDTHSVIQSALLHLKSLTAAAFAAGFAQCVFIPLQMERGGIQDAGGSAEADWAHLRASPHVRDNLQIQYYVLYNAALDQLQKADSTRVRLLPAPPATSLHEVLHEGYRELASKKSTDDKLQFRIAEAICVALQAYPPGDVVVFSGSLLGSLPGKGRIYAQCGAEACTRARVRFVALPHALLFGRYSFDRYLGRQSSNFARTLFSELECDAKDLVEIRKDIKKFTPARLNLMDTLARLQQDFEARESYESHLRSRSRGGAAYDELRGTPIPFPRTPIGKPQVAWELRPRKDQLGSVFLDNLSQLQIASAISPTPRVSVGPHHPYLTINRIDSYSHKEEPKSYLMWPLLGFGSTQPQQETQELEWAGRPPATMFQTAFRGVVMSNRDIASWAREHGIPRWYDSEDMQSRFGPLSLGGDQRREAYLIVRQGDVSGTSYDGSYIEAFDRGVRVLNGVKDDGVALNAWFHSDGVKQLEEDSSWGQASYTPDQIIKLVEFAVDVCLRANLRFRIAPQGSLSHEVTQTLEHYGVETLDTSDLDQTLRHYRFAKALFLSNSYLGFAAAVINKENASVYYPKNSMFAWFGIGTKFDTSGYKPYPDDIFK